MTLARLFLVAVITCLQLPNAYAGSQFVNWESPHVHPLDLTPDGTRLLAVNTPDNRLEIFDVIDGSIIHAANVPVGLDPVSVRARSNEEAWVVNHLSDSVSVVNLNTLNVVRTVPAADEPADVVFAGEPQRAFVSCSQTNLVLVVDPNDLESPVEIPIDAEEPKALAVSFDGTQVYAAIFESGNASTILGGGDIAGFSPNTVSDPAGPYGGVNPPPNDGLLFRPAQNPNNPPPPRVGLIVKKNENGQWMDDNSGDWTELVSGSLSHLSRRPQGWDLPDRDVAIIDTATLDVTYATGMTNVCMAVAVMPITNLVVIVGTDATNEVRYEPVLNGRFLRVHVAGVDPDTPDAPIVIDLNQHLTYTDDLPFQPIAQTERDKSIGDPRGLVWNAAGTRCYVTGMGSNNVAIIDNSGTRRAPVGDPTSLAIEVGEGPTGIVIHETEGRLYVLNKFAASISIIDLATEQVIGEVAFFDPSPAAIKVGRRHLYDTHKNSGLGHVSCASCHVDARMDRLAWDLGDPAGDMKTFDQNCFMGTSDDCTDFHPMKGPMTTQTLRDIIGVEPHHWRGDRTGIEEFNGAFAGLLGDDTMLTDDEMQEFEDFLATIHFPPNPFREFDNSLPTDLPLTGHFSTGRFGPAGEPMPNGNAQAALDMYRFANLDGVDCVTCHTLPTGAGSNYALVGQQFVPLPPGPDGELHHAIFPGDGSTQAHFKIPQLRSEYEKVGFDTTQTLNRSGFGVFHDGTIDSVTRFISLNAFSFQSRQEIADMVAFMLAFSGSDLPVGSPNTPEELPGPSSRDTHAAVGHQITFRGSNNNHLPTLQRYFEMIALAESGAVGLVGKGLQDQFQRGYTLVGGGTFQSDRADETFTGNELRSAAANESEITFTVVPAGTELRIGIDRDEDGFFDRDELDACSDPADALVTPDNVMITGDFNHDDAVDLADHASFTACRTAPLVSADPACRCAFDFDRDNDVDLGDFATLVPTIAIE